MNTYKSPEYFKHNHEESEYDMEPGGGCMGMMVGIALVATIAIAVGGYIFVKYILEV